MKREMTVKNRAFICSISFIFAVSSIFFLISCSGQDKEVTGEELGGYVLELDEDVDISRQRIEEFDIIEKEEIENLTPLEILDMMSLDYQYDYDDESSPDYDMVVADLVDGRKVMVVRFNKLTKIEAFYMQFQSNLDQKGYTFSNRLRYSEICNLFESENNDSDAYLLKRSNYLIMLVK